MDNLNKQYFETKEKHKKEFKKWGWMIWIGLFLVFLIYLYVEINRQTDNKVKIEETEIGINNLDEDLIENDTLQLVRTFCPSTLKPN